MKKLPALIVTLCLLWLCSGADATGCRQVVRHHQVVVDKVLLAEVIQVLQPAYQVIYQHPTNPDAELLALRQEVAMKNLEVKVLQLQAQLEAAMRGQRAIPQKGLEVDPPIQRQPKQISHASTNCAACHDRDRKDAKAPQYFTDGVFTGSAEDRLDCIEAVMSERMPKGKKINDEAASQVMAELSKRPAKKGI